MPDKEILLGHSPDSDDAFMFYGLTSGKVPSEGYVIKHLLSDIETLNQYATNGKLDLTAISLHAYAYVKSHYALMACGASMGMGYGPIIVATKPMTIEELERATIAVPGTMTTAFLVLRMVLGHFDYQVIPFDKILFQVAGGSVDAGLIIHEGQVNYGQMELLNVLDLGKWWSDQTGLPLPLGVNAVKRDLGPAVMKDLSRLVLRSIEYGMENPEEALDFAQDYARGLDRQQLETFVRMYVNQWTLRCGPEGTKAINELLYRAETERLIPPTLPVDFV
ncbi:MAG: ABC transporter substrate-binding protein [Phycisphaerae bacterium]|nr:ABC transporter substrate-binding protein [Phycisphaerae bacterium]